MVDFDYIDYKEFLKSRLPRGAQGRLANFLRCQSAFLSQVLRGKPHLSLEQGILVTDYFQMNSQSSEYFMCALELGRSGSVRLKTFFEAKMKKIKLDQLRIESKLEKFEQLDDSSKSVFYSSWKYAMAHVLLSIPKNDQIEYLNRKMGLSEAEIINILEFLRRSGLAEKKTGIWRPTKRRIHLTPEDFLISSHHKNFRTLSLKELEEYKKDSLYFSSVMALSKEDAIKIKTIFIDTIGKVESILTSSSEETVRILCLDFFEPGTSSGFA